MWPLSTKESLTVALVALVAIAVFNRTPIGAMLRGGQ